MLRFTRSQRSSRGSSLTWSASRRSSTRPSCRWERGRRRRGRACCERDGDGHACGACGGRRDNAAPRSGRGPGGGQCGMAERCGWKFRRSGGGSAGCRRDRNGWGKSRRRSVQVSLRSATRTGRLRHARLNFLSACTGRAVSSSGAWRQRETQERLWRCGVAWPIPRI